MDDWPPAALTQREPFREERSRTVGPSCKPGICTVEDVGVGYQVRVGYSGDNVSYTDTSVSP